MGLAPLLEERRERGREIYAHELRRESVSTQQQQKGDGLQARRRTLTRN